MVSRYLSNSYGNRGNNELFFESNLNVEEQQGSVVLQLALSPAVISTKFDYGYSVDTISPGKLQITKDGGKTWAPVNEGTTIRGDELHEFRIPAKRNDSVNFRAQLEGNKKVQLKLANAHYFVAPLQ